MSSKALATALLSYGSDLKIKNVLMEIFFSALPAIYMSRYKLIDSSDELIVDLLYQKVKATLKERGEYGIVVQSLMLETYPDLDLMEMTPAQISLLGEIAVKRLVYQGVTKISEKIYPDAPWSAQTFDPTLSKRDFLEDLFYVDYNYLRSDGSGETPQVTQFRAPMGVKMSTVFPLVWIIPIRAPLIVLSSTFV